MLRRGSAPAPLQGIHRARYSNFTANSHPNGHRAGELELPPVSPISPPDHEVAPLRRAPLANLSRRPSLPDSHLRLPSHPYYSHSYDRSREGSGPRMQRRGGLLSPVPDVGHEQEQGHASYHNLSIPTMLPPAPSLHPGQGQEQSQGPSRIYRALPPGMGANPAVHDLPTQFPARPGAFNNNNNNNGGWRLHAPARPFVDPVSGPLPAADFSFGAPVPGHGDAFNRAMEQENGEFTQGNGEFPRSTNDFNSNDFSQSNQHDYSSNAATDFSSSNPDFHAPDYSSSPTEFNPSSATSEFAPPGSTLWDARTRFGSMASIASDVTGVSISSTQATSVSGGLGTAGFGECEGPFDGRNGFGDNNGGFRNGFGYGLSAGYPTGFQPDMRRASCPGEFLHQFSGMGMNNGGGSPNESSGGPRSTSMSHMRPSPLGRSLTIAPDAASSSLPHNHHQNHNQNHNHNHRGLTLTPENHRPNASGVNLALEAKTLRSPTFPPGQVDPTYPPPPPGPSVSDRGPFAPRDQQQQPQHREEQRALVGGGFGSSDSGFGNGSGGGYEAEMRTPPGFVESPSDVSGGMDGMHSNRMDGMHSNGMDGVHSNGMEGMHSGGMGSSGKGSPMLFAGVNVEGDPSFGLDAMNPDSLAMAMIGHEYAMPGANEFAFP
ncbi:hypothetical protein FRC12_017784 [Ceratobasidium sp. 428]|nr:hypothetical protein FRC12_017784 [Ceratobasidium sp. 428]